MAKDDLRRAILQPNNGSIVVYYSRKGIMRFPTGITISKEKTKDGRFKEWDYKAAFIKPLVLDYETRKTKLNYWLQRANDILSINYSEGQLLTALELKALLSTRSAPALSIQFQKQPLKQHP